MSEELCRYERKRRSCLLPREAGRLRRAAGACWRRAPELEGLGLGIVPPTDPPQLASELVDEAVDRAAGRRRVRQALGMPSDRRISDEVIDELLAGASTEEEIAGPGGLLAELTKRLVERAMEVADRSCRGYEPHCEPPGGAANQRNGTSPEDADHRAREGPGRRSPRNHDGSTLSRRSSASASGGSSRTSTRRSSRSTAAGSRRGISRRTSRRSTA